MRLPRPIRRLYYAHETLAKVSGVVIFLVVVASLYVALLRPAPTTSEAVGVIPTPTVSPSATTTATTTPQTPGVAPTPTPPKLPGPYQVTVKNNLGYGPSENLAERLDLCTPVGAAGLRPGLVLIHGDNFVNGDKKDDDPLCLAYASYGFVAASLNYRLAPQNTWPAPLVDAQLAVRWLRANASQNQLDPQRLCALGDSAGGNLAVFLGVLTANHPGDKASLLSDQSPQVSCVVDEYGPMDMSALTTIPDWQSIFSNMFGSANKNNPNLLRDASPVFFVTSQSVPTLIIQGAIDVVVPPSQSKALQSKLQASNIPVSYISYPGGHGYSGLTAKQISAISDQILSFLTAQEHP